MKIGSRDINENVLIIAEIGANHEGNMDLAKQLIHLAKEAGADAVKFQTYQAEKIVAITEPSRREHFKRLSLSALQFQELSTFAKHENIMFLSTPFDLESADMLDSLGVPAFKISSGDLTFLPLLTQLAKKQKPLIISTGLATIDEIESVILYLNSIDHKINDRLAILHCVTSYPTPFECANLGRIIQLSKRYPDITIGYSDHTLGNTCCQLAVSMGARIIEKHFTIDKQYSNFRDHQLSADPKDLKELCHSIRVIEEFVKDSKDNSELEKNNIQGFRRSLAAAVPLKPGDTLSESTLTCLRPGIGIPATSYYKVLGKTINKSFVEGEIIQPQDLS